MSKADGGTGPNLGGQDRGSMSPDERADYERRLAELGKKLDQTPAAQLAAKATARKDGTGGEDAAQARSRAMGMGFSIATQLVAGVLVGGGIGYFLDRWLGSTPWLMVLFLGLGFAAGMKNVIRTAREMQKISVAQSKGARSVPDDDDDK